MNLDFSDSAFSVNAFRSVFEREVDMSVLGEIPS